MNASRNKKNFALRNLKQMQNTIYDEMKAEEQEFESLINEVFEKHKSEISQAVQIRKKILRLNKSHNKKLSYKKRIKKKGYSLKRGNV